MYMDVYVCICTYMFVAYQCSHSLKRITLNNVVGWSKPALASESASHCSTGPLGHGDGGGGAAGYDHALSPSGSGGGPAADSSSLESQPVMVRFQLEVHSGPGHAGDGRGCIRCSQCQADSSSHYDAGGWALSLSALRAGLILFSEPVLQFATMP